MTSIDKQLITGLILSGGRGTRMGSVDKGLQIFRGAPMAMHVFQRLSPQVGNMLINANQNLLVYESFGAPVWPDHTENNDHHYLGPLAGLQTGLMHCKTPYLASVPCDSPFLPANLVAHLVAALLQEDADIAVAVTMESNGDVIAKQAHPVFSLMKISLLPQLSDFLRSGGRKVDTWHASLHCVDVVFEDVAAFRNINTLQDLRQYEI